MERIIGRYTGKNKGPLLICIGGMHGNESAGVMALDLIFKMLEVEPITNPDFNYKGKIIGLRGNLKALEAKSRFIDCDLNRLWTKENVDKIFSKPQESLNSEEQELKSLLTLVKKEVEEYKPEKLYILDLHTTTATGGIFSIVPSDSDSIITAIELHAPVVLGMLNGIKGTTLQFFTGENMGVPTVAICFESGQHDEPLSVNRAIAGVINCMRIVGSVDVEHVENRHDYLLIKHSKGLPKVTELVYHHRIEDGDGFRMQPEYQNFQRIVKGELLARDDKGAIYSQADGLILMPHYQTQGEDGFFLIREKLPQSESNSK